MVQLQSKTGNCYEYDSETSFVDEDVYGKCYRDFCQHGKPVLIHVYHLGWNRCIVLALFIIFIIFISPSLSAQNQMRIHYKDGTCGDVPIEKIDSITFVDDEGGEGEEVQVKELTGSWLWGSVTQGYYELLTFNVDKTYIGYDNYFTYGFDTMTYGYYSVYGAMLNMWSNGFGYQHRYNWFITALTENALGVMTKMGPFTYYKLQPEVIRLKVNESLACAEGDSFVFADGVVVSIEDNKLLGISPGTTYVQMQSATTNRIYAYKVIVE